MAKTPKPKDSVLYLVTKDKKTVAQEATIITVHSDSTVDLETAIEGGFGRISCSLGTSPGCWCWPTETKAKAPEPDPKTPASDK